MTARFVDTSVLLRFLLDESDERSERTTRLIDDVGNGREEIHLSVTVIFEAVYILNKRYNVPRTLVAQHMFDLLNMGSVILPEKAGIREAFDFWTKQPPLSFADCYHLILAKSLGLTEIYSYDKKMGRYPGVTRVEP
jgi:predicted nucleic acid-binding protein